jgi:CheY-like chemotaxis protein
VNESILIVDDEFGLAELVGEVLAERGYQTRVATNGQQGLDVLEKDGIDLVLVDLMMPVLDGREMSERMRSDARYEKIPIVMMTAVPEALNGAESLFEAVLPKPFSAEELFTTLDRLLS